MAENASAETEPEGQPPLERPTEDSPERSLEVYEWGGGIVAGLGFFFTPLLTGVPAAYCAMKIHEEKPLAAAGIGIVVLVTMLFWGGFLFGEELISYVNAESAVVVGLLFLIVLVIPALVFLFVLLFRR